MVAAKEKHPHGLPLPPPCFAVGIVCPWLFTVFYYTKVYHEGWNVQLWFDLFNREASYTCSLCPLCGLWETVDWHFYRFLSTIVFFLHTLAWTQDFMSGRLIFVLLTDSPTWAVNLCSSVDINMASWLLLWSSECCLGLCDADFSLTEQLHKSLG